ncbi:MAG TPA: pitrilysin family protein [Candidatus Acidoferrum sp.]|nr:pitrilysin family protein [Candidatus Acidoferrum sp.]
MHQITRLSNGLIIATAEMPYMASVAVGLWVGVGGRFEPTEISGVAHFIEHLLFKGTGRRSAKQISEAVEGVGGYLNAFTTEENTCFHARAHADRTNDLLDVLVDMFVNSRFAPADISKERDVIKEEIAMYQDQPQQLVQDLLHETLWPNHPLGRPLTGTEKTLNAIRRTDLLGFLRTNYGTGNTVLAVAGPLRHADVLRRCKKLVGKFSDGKKPAFVPADAQQNAPVVHLQTKKTEQTQLALGVRACSRHDERRFAVRVLNAIVGESMSSRLFQILREDKGIAYSIYSSWAFMEDTGALTISAGLDHDDIEKSLRIIARELRKLGETPVGSAELRRARDFVIGQMELSLEGTENQMNWVGESLLGYGRILDPREVKQRLAAVSAAEVRSAAREFLQPQRLNLALVSPLEKTLGLEKLLRW